MRAEATPNVRRDSAERPDLKFQDPANGLRSITLVGIVREPFRPLSADLTVFLDSIDARARPRRRCRAARRVPQRSTLHKATVPVPEPQPFDFLRNESFRQLHRLNGGLV